MKESQIHITYMHVLAAFLVVIGHALLSTNSLYGGKIGEMKYIADFLYLFHVPLFMCVSGYLFQYSEVYCKNGKTSFSEFFKKKTQRLLVPFFIVMFFFTKPIKIMTKIYSTIDLRFLLATHHLWYLYVLFVISIIAKALLPWVRKNRINVWIVVISGILLNLFSNYYEGPVHHIMFYIYYFLMGVLLCIGEKAGLRIWKIGALSPGLLIVFWILARYSNHALAVLEAIKKTTAGTTIVLLIFSCFESTKNRELPRIISVLGRYTMGIYLFHQPLMNVFSYLVKAPYIFPWLIFAIMTSVCVIISIAITFVLRKAKFSFVLGEKVNE